MHQPEQGFAKHRSGAFGYFQGESDLTFGETEYWIGGRPERCRQWLHTEHATVVHDSVVLEALQHLYQRYAAKWNAQLDDQGQLQGAQDRTICGARVMHCNNYLILHAGPTLQGEWVLEIRVSQDFPTYAPSGYVMNALRSIDDMGEIHLHWRGHGDVDFVHWIAKEKNCNQGLQEWEKFQG